MHTHTHTHTQTHTHTLDSDEYSIVAFCKNATIKSPYVQWGLSLT